MLALSETKLQGRVKCEFDEVSRRKSGGQEGFVLILRDRLASNVAECKEVSSRVMWVKVKLGIERL